MSLTQANLMKYKCDHKSSLAPGGEMSTNIHWMTTIAAQLYRCVHMRDFNTGLTDPCQLPR